MSDYTSWRPAKFQMQRGKVYSVVDGDWDYYEIGLDGHLYGYASCSSEFIRIEGEELTRVINSEWYWIADESYMRKQTLTLACCEPNEREIFLLEDGKEMQIEFQDLKKGDWFLIKDNGVLVENNEGISEFQCEDDAFYSEEFKTYMVNVNQ